MNVDTFFINCETKSLRYVIYCNENLPIELKCNENGHYLASAQRFQLLIERHKAMNLIQIRVINVNDKTTIFICTVDDIRFSQFKDEQSLHVSFEYFVKHLTQMLDECRDGRLHVSMTIGNDGIGQIQLYEKGTFKNLVHITLPIERASMDVILFYVNESYVKMIEQNTRYAQEINNMKFELNQTNEELKMTHENTKKLQHELSEQEKRHIQRLKENTYRLEQEFKSNEKTRELQRQELDKQIVAFKAHIDRLVKENTSLAEQLKAETKTTNLFKIENQKLNDLLKELQGKVKQIQSERSEKNIASQKIDHILSEQRKQLQSLQEKNENCEKQITELTAELEAERNICQIKRDGLKLATEDICNANAIIRKQAKEIAMLREKIDWRTEVALKQEEVIRKKGNATDKIQRQMESIEDSLKENCALKIETESKMKWLQEQTNLLEDKYQSRIDALYDKIMEINRPARTSTGIHRRN